MSFSGLVVRLDDANIHACLSTESAASTDSVRYAIGASSKWRELSQERERYAMVVHEYVDPKTVRLTSPLFRNRGNGCKLLPHSVRNADPRLQICDGNHRPDEGCCIRRRTFHAAYSPEMFQCPNWGSPDWEPMYARRTALERCNSRWKMPEGVGSRDQLRLRGLVAVSLWTALGLVVHNLKLRALVEDPPHPPPAHEEPEAA